MPRAARLVIDGGTYHVMTRGNNGQPVFREASDCQRYLDFLLIYVREHELSVFHYALMPNHVHLVLQTRRAERLSHAMHGLNLSYALFFRKRYRYSGHLWQGRFKSLAIEKESYLLECGRYVELNPVRAGIVKHPKEYLWSSYRVYAEGLQHPLVTYHPLYEAMGASPAERQQHYQEFIQATMDAVKSLDAPSRFFPDLHRVDPWRSIAHKVGFPPRRSHRPATSRSGRLAAREVSPLQEKEASPS